MRTRSAAWFWRALLVALASVTALTVLAGAAIAHEGSGRPARSRAGPVSLRLAVVEDVLRRGDSPGPASHVERARRLSGRAVTAAERTRPGSRLLLRVMNAERDVDRVVDRVSVSVTRAEPAALQDRIRAAAREILRSERSLDVTRAVAPVSSAAREVVAAPETPSPAAVPDETANPRPAGPLDSPDPAPGPERRAEVGGPRWAAGAGPAEASFSVGDAAPTTEPRGAEPFRSTPRLPILPRGDALAGTSLRGPTEHQEVLALILLVALALPNFSTWLPPLRAGPRTEFARASASPG